MVEKGNFIAKGDEFRALAASKLKGSFFGNFMQGKAER